MQKIIIIDGRDLNYIDFGILINLVTDTIEKSKMKVYTQVEMGEETMGEETVR